ncbi:sodium:proton antiporter NhaD [Flavobacterium cheniae]|uniref:Na+/H+ antiporter NhaD/arsenite permease-like protein n=1 Tax=Flavobacterium cheniae TaxID=295428 RepID=A0A562KSF9_9FLAO|nr:sodium:proton antiporter NhaD [Flavobacterium cheniae]TDR25444.1 sodium/proton antiporter (NhaD family) [Flavobacterium cheniae]TWH98369.1 Na+/H+ antiporter NhaD/arsenite permease-like protein [Flavobacterium cheniae]
MIPILLFVAILGYLSVILESPIRINKTITALLTGTICWVVIALYSQDDHHLVTERLMEYFGEISGLLIFLMGAMTIVELIDIHKGFTVITSRIRTTSVLKLLWIVAFITFFLSALLDNLATAIIMVTLLRKLMPKGEIRMILTGIVVIAANAGGAFSPIGDVTTTLLWIGGQVSAGGIIKILFLPSLAVLIVPVIIASFRMRGFAVLRAQVSMAQVRQEEKMRGSMSVFIAGVLGLVMVPIIKTLTGLPPFIGVLISLSMVSLVSIVYHRNKTQEEKDKFSVAYALTKVDISSILYFMGILLMVFALQEVGILREMATFLVTNLPSTDAMIIAIGFLSSIVDNGSLVAATQGMFSLVEYPMDHTLWEFIALCAGTGGSMMIIGSAAGIAVMEKEKITFMWYLKKITPLAVAGYIAGIIVYELQYLLTH